jgi:hypothetical protein
MGGKNPSLLIEEKRGERHVRVEEPLVLAIGKVIEIVLDSRFLIVWTRKL